MLPHPKQYGDPAHAFFRYYAFVFGLVYCLGIPLGSLLVLQRYKEDIQRLQLIQVCLATLSHLSSRNPSVSMQTPKVRQFGLLRLALIVFALLLALLALLFEIQHLLLSHRLLPQPLAALFECFYSPLLIPAH
jgi:hypothetical protein